MINETTSTKYSLEADVHLIINDAEIRLRKGIWNYEEGSITLEGCSQEFSRCLKETFMAMNGNGFSLDSFNEYVLEPFEREQAETIVSQLAEAGFIVEENDKLLHQQITRILTGGINLFEDDGDFYIEGEKSVVFYTDNDSVRKKWSDLVKSHRIKAKMMSDEQASMLRTVDLTTNIDSLTTNENIDLMGKWIEDAHAIVICVSQLSVCFMRNINRLSINKGVPVTLAFIDGPTINLLSTKPYKTGCLECFERRALSRLEDHVQYARFIEETRAEMGTTKKNQSSVLLMDLLANLSFAEGFMYSVIGASRFAGRLLSIYLPTLEIQMQNILRAPFCEACGTVSKAQFRELNISSRKIIDDLSSRVFGRE